MLDAEIKNLLYNACCADGYTTLRENLIISEIDTPLDDQGNTALHIATLHGHPDLIRLLIRYHASQTILNNEGKKPDEMTSDDAIKKIFEISFQTRSISTDNHYVANELSVEPIEWLDSYRNAYRISYENHEYLKRWITEVPLNKLLEEINEGYIDKMSFSTEANRAKVKEYLQYAIDENNPLPLAILYPGTTMFCTHLNRDLAKLGPEFRFVSTRLDYLDNEPPKDVGQYIYASLLINHTVFRPYQQASTTYRGTNISSQDLEACAMGKILITRSFLSTSKNREAAETYLGFDDITNRSPVICIYKVTNPRSSLCTESFSDFPEEKEVLIAPFIAFEITAVREVKMKRQGIERLLTEIEFVECGPNPT